MIGCIAYLRGHDLEEEIVQLLCVAALVGDKTIAAAMAGFGKQLAAAGAKAALAQLNKRIGLQLLAKVGEGGFVNIAQAVPLAGGVAGGLADAGITSAVAAVATRTFPDIRGVGMPSPLTEDPDRRATPPAPGEAVKKRGLPARRQAAAA